MNILGINAYHGDAAACLVQDGQLIAAVAEERFNRKKHCAGFPTLAINYCLEAGGIQASDLDHIAISRNPAAHIHKKVLSLAKSFIPRITTIKDRVANAGRVRSLDTEFSAALGIARSDLKAKFHHVEHHRAHLASAFLVSPYDDSAVLSVDGFGDFVSTMMGHGRGTNVEVLDWVEYPHSLGLLYTAASQYIGFPKYGDEGKVMGLAPCGTPRYLEQFQKIVRLVPGGKFELNLDYFLHHSQGVEMVWDEGTPVIGQVWSPAFVEALGPARLPTDPLEERHEDIAASLQRMLELALLHVCQNLHERTSSERLCLAGGVALNCTFNGMIRENTPFKDVYIQAAAGDDGTSIGAAYHVHNQVNGAPRTFVMQHPYTGPSFSDDEIAAVLKRRGIDAKRCENSSETSRETAKAMARGDVVGWFQGGMEMGPRALGNRSIVVDPRRAEMKDILNSRIKHREPFRPFAPSILAERVGDYFEQDYPSPFMLMAYRVRPEKQSVIPAVTHVDGTGRLQTVDRAVNPLYWELITAFETETGVPVILNTSFNENEPVVCTPDEALDCFFKTRMDLIVLGNFMVRRPDEESPKSEVPEAQESGSGEAGLEESSLDGATLGTAGLEALRTARPVGAQP